MAVVPCLQNDGGQCAVPDPAVVLSRGTVSLVAAHLVERLLPELAAGEGVLRELPQRVELSRVVESLAYAPAEGHASQEEHVFGTSQLTDGVVVQCSCGHQWLWTT